MRDPISEPMVNEYIQRIQAGDLPCLVMDDFRERFPTTFPHDQNDNTTRERIVSKGKTMGIKRSAFRSKYHGGPKRTSVPSSHKDFSVLKPELTIPFEPKLAVASDAHFPVHSVKACERFVQMCAAHEIPTVIFNGDQLNNDYKGHKGIHEVYQAPFLKGVQALCDFLEALMDAGVSKMIFVMGNHDDKPLRGTDGELSFSDWWKTMVFDRTSGRAEFLASDRYYVEMKCRNPKAPKSSPDRYEWLFTHQSNYGQIPLSVGRKISANKIANVVTGHQHHMAMGKAPSNSMWLVDAGCLADPKLAGYKEMRHSGHPEWTPGFVTITHGVPELWDIDNPDEWWEEYV